MTVINVTDATLKGDVTGPTFTGKVDGSKFSGSVTYTDTTTPPEPPVESGGPTGGLITTFSAKSNTDTIIDGIRYRAWNNNQAHCLQKVDDYTLRFEMRPGDRSTDTGDSSSVNRDGSDGYQKRYPDNKVIKFAYRIMIEPGAPQNVPWFVLGQYTTDENNATGGNSPIFATELTGEKFSAVLRYCRPGGNPSNNSPDLHEKTVWKQSNNLVRGQWYVFEIECKTNQTAGYLKIKMDGVEVANYSGPIGFGNNGNYWAFGLYRAADPSVTIIAHYKNMMVT